MAGTKPLNFRRSALALATAAGFAFPIAAQAQRGPDRIADVAEAVIDAVVNISTSQTVAAGGSSAGARRTGAGRRPASTAGPWGAARIAVRGILRGVLQEPPWRPRGSETAERGPRRVNSLGSGFVIDATGLIVTNNHVISEADEITAVFNDGSKLKAEVLGRDSKTDLALLRVKPEKPLKAVKFANSDKLRLGEWVIAIGNPFSLGGSVTAGIVSARNRDINSGPYDNYIQTDAAINRGNSGGPLFNLEGEVVGVNTAIISPSGGSIGIGFAVPANTAMAVLDQLREFKEVRRGWLGVKHPAGDRRDRREPQHQAGARCAGRRRRRQGPGEARRHRAGRRDRQVRRQGHQGDARPAEDRRRHAGRQGRAGDRGAQGQGRDQDGAARPPRGHAAAGLGEDRCSRRRKSRSCRRRSASTSPA